jgi:hypothetical protein
MLMLIDTSGRYGGPPGDPDPDEERERRWEPISRRIFLPVAGSFTCLALTAGTPPLVGWLLIALALGLCLYAAKQAMPGRDTHE